VPRQKAALARNPGAAAISVNAYLKTSLDGAPSSLSMRRCTAFS
jgi:hypothetical protein